MSRPSLPDSEKRRTIPLRLSKPEYRHLLAIMQITDRPIQEHLRTAVETYLEDVTEELKNSVQSVQLPSPYELGVWSDARFNAWMDTIGAASDAPKAAKPKFGRRAA